MALPKRRFSKARSRKKRAHKKLNPIQLNICPQCKQPKLPHRLCPVCGYYKGKEIIHIETKEKKKKEK